MYIFHTHALRVNEAPENPLCKNKRKEKAHGAEAVDGMETAVQREATWNGTVHSFNSQVLAEKKKTEKQIK